MLQGLGMPIGLPLAVVLLLIILILPSLRNIGPTEVGLVMKRFSRKKLPDDNPIAFKGEAGYQADLLMPGWRFKLWIVFRVEKHPWVQVPAGEIGVVIAQVGQPLPIGAKSAVYKNDFGNFSNLRGFIQNGGQKGVQRPVLPPGTLIPIHPVGFLVITRERIYGVPVSPEFHVRKLNPESFGLKPEQLLVTRIEPQQDPQGGVKRDMIGIVTILEGDPLPAGDIASRLGGFNDVARAEKDVKNDTEMIEVILGSKNHLHNNYQDFQAFLNNGGKIGLQYDPLLYGAYNLNPFLVSVEKVPMLVVEQGEVAVIKSYVGLPTEDISGAEFKFGSLVKPGHRGIWQEPLRTGKYPINPRCYQAEIVPTYILTLNWAEATSQAHRLDINLKPIEAKSREGFVFMIDLQVQIHVPDTKAPRVISVVGTMQNLVNEVLQAAVGNHFRDKLQSMPAVRFIETRQMVQEEALAHIRKHLAQYEVETKGVYIQDVVLPPKLVEVLTQREIANQEIETFKKQKEAQTQRKEQQKEEGLADRQKELATSEVDITIKKNYSKARENEGKGDAAYTRLTGEAEGYKFEKIGLGKAKGYTAQVEALGRVPTAFVNIASVLGETGTKIMPNILVVGGGNGSGALDGALATLMQYLSGDGKTESVKKPKTEKELTTGTVEVLKVEKPEEGASSEEHS